jgi:hypothetical protein
MLFEDQNSEVQNPSWIANETRITMGIEKNMIKIAKPIYSIVMALNLIFFKT